MNYNTGKKMRDKAESMLRNEADSRFKNNRHKLFSCLKDKFVISWHLSRLKLNGSSGKQRTKTSSDAVILYNRSLNQKILLRTTYHKYRIDINFDLRKISRLKKSNARRSGVFCFFLRGRKDFQCSFMTSGFSERVVSRQVGRARMFFFSY